MDWMDCFLVKPHVQLAKASDIKFLSEGAELHQKEQFHGLIWNSFLFLNYLCSGVACRDDEKKVLKAKHGEQLCLWLLGLLTGNQRVACLQKKRESPVSSWWRATALVQQMDTFIIVSVIDKNKENWNGEFVLLCSKMSKCNLNNKNTIF